MEWFRLDASFPEHPKVGRLGRTLGVSRNEALALLVRLWCWTAQNREDGSLEGLEACELAEVVAWPADRADTLLNALVRSGWLDQDNDGLRVHEWIERHGKMLRERDRNRTWRASQKDRARSERVASALATCDRPTDRQDRPDQRKAFCAEPVADAPASAPAPGDPRSPVFPTVGKGPASWQATTQQIGEWAAAFPALDVPGELRRAHAWVCANRRRAKTGRGMPAFLVGWLNRSQDHGGGRPSQPDLGLKLGARRTRPDPRQERVETRQALLDAALAVEQSGAPEPARAQAAAGLRRLAEGAPGDPEGIGRALEAACRESLGEDERAELQRKARDAIRDRAASITPDAARRWVDSLVARDIRQRFRLPTLALVATLPPGQGGDSAEGEKSNRGHPGDSGSVTW